ncbi:hypothetical protein AVEN_212487-1 [Araneus ventricosus]|uniref:Uncharacterized protein n=1 Tax=Araneus ventricosus TaxID=182803 RepID=A0A4Y2K2L0_ARAVE|nr:hypothetical protein AVEN_212487-1 [Araneus ventricosus]
MDLGFQIIPPDKSRMRLDTGRIDMENAVYRMQCVFNEKGGHIGKKLYALAEDLRHIAISVHHIDSIVERYGALKYHLCKPSGQFVCCIKTVLH